MAAYDPLERLFVVTAFAFQIVLIIHFGLRRWRFHSAVRYGPAVYGLSIPAAIVSLVLIAGGKPWPLWIGGFLYLVWAAFGYTVEYVKKIEFRGARVWSILGPYVLLYLSTVMFYWFPLANIDKTLWYEYAIFFLISTYLNVTSHRPGSQGRSASGSRV